MARSLRAYDGAALYAEGLELLADDRAVPLDVKEAKREEPGDATVVDRTYASPLGGRVPAFLDEAVELPGRGVVSLAISAPFARPDQAPLKGPWNPEQERREQRQAMLDVRRGFDLLAALPSLPHATGAVLFQFALRDESITPWDAALFSLATAAPHEVKSYDTDHFFNAEARSERDEWLLRALGTGTEAK